MSHEATENQGTMLLDIGNTNLKWVVIQGDKPGKIISVAHQGRIIPELAYEQWGKLSVPSSSIIANVAGKEMELTLSEWISANWGHEPRIIQSSKYACGVTNSYKEPERLGVDRWLTMIALVDRIPGPVCVVDCGTAVTIDAMTSGGQHLGGLILPGFGLMRSSLEAQTAIPIRDKARIGQLLATDTESAIANGGVNAVAALVEKVQHQLEDAESSEVSVILTGSDAMMLKEALSIEADIHSDLVIQGLIELSRKGL